MSQIVKFQDSKELSIANIIESPAKHLATLRKNDEKTIKVNLTALVIELCSIYKVDESKNISDNEIKEIVNIILSDYFFLKWEDMLLFLKNAKMGKYGKIYGSLDMPTFFQMLETYCENRSQEAATINRVKAIEQKKEPMSEATIKMIAEFKMKQAEKRKAQYITNEVKQLSEEQKIINEWINEFKDKVGYLQGFLEVEGKMLSIEQYLKYRYENM